MKRTFSLLMALLLMLTACGPGSTEPIDYLATESPQAFEARMAWWREARLGMFIHWGAYAVPAGTYKGNQVSGVGEWIMNSAHIPIPEYEQFVSQFNPEKFDADEWARIAKDAGMKYIIITSKHHDGFCLWDSKVSQYDIVDATPYGKDLLAQLKEACDREGIKLGFYHSIMDWHHPDAQGTHYPDYNTGQKENPNFQRYVEEYLKPQIQELVTQYDPAVLWFDGEWIPEWTHENGVDMYNFVRNLKPDILINNRVDKGRQGMQGMTMTDQTYAGDFGTPEQEILAGASTLDWESCMTMNDTWGFKSFDENWKSAETLVHNLIDISAKGGNYLLNVGPTAEGLIPEASVARLARMGQWMRTNGEAIYGSRLWEQFKDGESVRYLQGKDGSIYVVALEWPGKDLHLRYLKPDPGSEIRMLGQEAALTWTWDAREGLRISLPDKASLSADIAWTFKVSGTLAAVAARPSIGTESQPQIAVDIFTEGLEVIIGSSETGATFHYTLDGSEPTLSSPVYQQPLLLKATTTVRAIASVTDKVNSPSSMAEFRKSRYNGITLTHPFSENYTGGGRLALLDGVFGSSNFKDGRWQGFAGDDLEAVIDLGAVRPVSRIQVTFLQDQGVWIFLPSQVELALSADGESFKKVKSQPTGELLPDTEVLIEGVSHALSPAQSARYVKVSAKNIGICPEWHGGAGGKAWLFVDEVVVE